MSKVISGPFKCADRLTKYALLKKIETAVYEHPWVAEVAVCFSQEDVITAFIVPKDNRLNILELKSFLTSSLAPAELPQVYRFVQETPKTLTGKCPKTIDTSKL